VSHARGYEPHFDIDLNRGLSTEKHALNVRQRLIAGYIEAKRDERALHTGNLYIEFEHNPGGSGLFVPSGIARTWAWDYFIDLSPSVAIVILTEYLEELVRKAHRAGRIGYQERGDCPTRGALVPLVDVLTPTNPSQDSETVRAVPTIAHPRQQKLSRL